MPFIAKSQSIYVERTTDVLCLAPTLVGLCATVVSEDEKGAIELGLSTATCLAANYVLEAIIKKDRPDGSSHHAFPSTHTAMSFSGATFLMKRYGWRWGVPAYAVSAYVAWGRTYAQKHDWWDVAAGAAIGVGCAFVLSHKKNKDKNLSLSPISFGESSVGITASLSF